MRHKLNGYDGYTYILYNTDKSYLFEMARNKGLKLVWKYETDFYIIDFRSNTKGNIVCYLLDEDTKAGKIEGNRIKPN